MTELSNTWTSGANYLFFFYFYPPSIDIYISENNRQGLERDVVRLGLFGGGF